MKNQKYNGEFDTFETPSNLWANIEAALDEKKTRIIPFLWWKVAGAFLVVLGTGAFFLLNSNSSQPKEKLLAKNEPKKEKKLLEKVIDTIVPQEKIKVTLEEIDIPMPQVTMTNALPVCHLSPTNLNVSSMDYVSYNWTPTSMTSSFSYDGATAPMNYSINLTTPGSYTSTFGLANQQGFINANIGASRFNVGIDDLGRTNSREPWDSDGEEGEEYTSSSTYDEFAENDYLKTSAEPLSTFSIDVDGASYSDVRGMINRGEKPNLNSIRLEEFVNYFPYKYDEPQGEHPFSIQSELSNCPWNPEHQLLKVGIKGKSIDKQQLPTNNLVFLMDVSGSMSSPEKLDLLKQGFKLLIKEMREEDRVSICVYAGAAGVVLPPTSGANKDLIWDALNNLEAGGSTAGGEGIELAYKLAEENFDKNGNNRVILATDGDFNVGVSDDDVLVELIEEKRKTGVFLTVLGFGHDNFQSSKMEKLANNGNGNFSFIDNILEAKKVLVTEMGATLQAIAKDVKIQIEFNPALVSEYRLIGYENRLLANEDFSNDTIDAGELGAGHTVTAVYEIIPANGNAKEANSTTDLKYSTVGFNSKNKYTDELGTLKFRYKEPDGVESKLIETTISAKSNECSEDFQFIQAVLEFGLILRESKYAGTANLEDVLTRAMAAKGEDPNGYRAEFILLVEKAKQILTVE